jgi:hypothetical protein
VILEVFQSLEAKFQIKNKRKNWQIFIFFQAENHYFDTIEGVWWENGPNLPDLENSLNL